MKRALHGDAAPALLLVGLRNPGPQHARTRHNAGAMALDRLVAAASSFGPWAADASAGADTARGTLGGVHVLAAKPGSFMNLSGRSVQRLAAEHALAAECVVVVHDDLDLATGRVKIKRGGSSGGHRGVESCAARLGTPGYWRVRIGIGRPAAKANVPAWVVSRFTAPEAERLETVFGRLGLAAHLLPAALRDSGVLSTLLNALASDGNAAKCKARAARAGEGAPSDEGGARDRKRRAAALGDD